MKYHKYCLSAIQGMYVSIHYLFLNVFCDPIELILGMFPSIFVIFFHFIMKNLILQELITLNFSKRHFYNRIDVGGSIVIFIDVWTFAYRGVLKVSLSIGNLLD